MISPKTMAKVVQIVENPYIKLFELTFQYPEGGEFRIFLPAHQAKVGDIYPVTRAMLTGEVNGIKYPWLKGGKIE